MPRCIRQKFLEADAPKAQSFTYFKIGLKPNASFYDLSLSS